MADQVTQLENELDKLFAAGRDQLAFPGHVQSWEDYLQRRGYLTAITDIGRLIKKIRNPEDVNETGEIFSVLTEDNHAGT